MDNKAIFLNDEASLILNSDNTFLICVDEMFVSLIDGRVILGPLFENSLSFSWDNHYIYTFINKEKYYLQVINGGFILVTRFLHSKEIVPQRRSNTTSDTLGYFLSSGSNAIIFKRGEYINKVGFIEELAREFENSKYFIEEQAELFKLSENDRLFVLSHPQSYMLKQIIEANEIMERYEQHGEGAFVTSTGLGIFVDKSEYDYCKYQRRCYVQVSRISEYTIELILINILK